MLKKSQAALEFLTTYAWAFLVIIIMVGALAYFGILKPGKLLPDRCNFGTEFGCIDYSINYGTGAGTAGTVSLRIKNSIGESIVVDSISITNEASTPLACTAPTVTNWASDGIKSLQWTACNTAAAGIVKGEKAKAGISITYHTAKSSSAYAHTVLGEVFSTVN